MRKNGKHIRRKAMADKAKLGDVVIALIPNEEGTYKYHKAFIVGHTYGINLELTHYRVLVIRNGYWPQFEISKDLVISNLIK